LNPTANDASAVRDHHLSPNMSKFRSNREIVVEKLRKNVSEIDREFGQWFDQQGLPGQGAAALRLVIMGPEQRAYPCETDIKNNENSSPTKPSAGQQDRVLRLCENSRLEVRVDAHRSRQVIWVISVGFRSSVIPYSFDRPSDTIC